MRTLADPVMSSDEPYPEKFEIAVIYCTIILILYFTNERSWYSTVTAGMSSGYETDHTHRKTRKRRGITLRTVLLLQNINIAMPKQAQERPEVQPDDEETKRQARAILHLTDDDDDDDDDEEQAAGEKANNGEPLASLAEESILRAAPKAEGKSDESKPDDTVDGSPLAFLPRTSLERGDNVVGLETQIGAISVHGPDGSTHLDITSASAEEDTSNSPLQEATAIDAELALSEEELQTAKEAVEAERDALKERLEKLEHPQPSRDEELPSVVVAVAEMEPSGNDNKRRVYLGVALVLLLVAITVAVVLGITLSDDKNDDSPKTSNTSQSSSGGSESILNPVDADTDYGAEGDSPSTDAAIPPAAPFDSLFGNIVFNEVADVGNPMVCGHEDDKYADYMELKNIGPEDIDLAGMTLKDDKGVVGEQRVFPTGTIVEAGELLVLCRGGTLDDGDFIFGIGGNDILTLIHTPTGNVIAQVGPMNRMGSSALTYQRLDDGSYDYFYPTPGKETTGEGEAPAGNFTATNAMISNSTEPTQPPVLKLPTFPLEYYENNVVINEVADKGNPSICVDSADYVELKNTGSTPLDLTGLVLHDDDAIHDGTAYVFPTNTSTNILDPNAFLVLCQAADFAFKIGGSDTITLLHLDSGVAISVAGRMTRGGNATSTYQRKNDGTYGYALPTPNAANGW